MLVQCFYLSPVPSSSATPPSLPPSRPPSLPPYLPSFLANSTARLSPKLAQATREGVTRQMTAVLPLESAREREGGRGRRGGGRERTRIIVRLHLSTSLTLPFLPPSLPTYLPRPPWWRAPDAPCYPRPSYAPPSSARPGREGGREGGRDELREHPVDPITREEGREGRLR